MLDCYGYVIYITYSFFPTQILYYRVSITLLILFHILSYQQSLLKTQPFFLFTSTLYILKQQNVALKYYLNNRESSSQTSAETFPKRASVPKAFQASKGST